MEHLERLPLQRLLTCLLMGDPDLSLEEPELELILAVILQSVIDLDMTVTYG